MLRGKPSSTARYCAIRYNIRAARCFRLPCIKSTQLCIDCLAHHYTNKTQFKNQILVSSSQPANDISSVSNSISSRLITTPDTSIKLHQIATSCTVSSIEFH
ncbi:hypothetical protein GJ496_004867 [Pomphorhynchus laevis]|nr:hypothetical protein GJ496_004867 [Pomphorhynchus laevis]